MARLQPWAHVIPPREDLRQGRPLDASEFAVHLDHVRRQTAPDVYKKPREFFERTYLTDPLLELTTQVVRRLSGVAVQTSAVYNMATQFGGGKSHALTMLYHLARLGEEARGFPGVDRIIAWAEVAQLPQADMAVFVGTEFDPISGRAARGEPTRFSPWGEIAWQIGRQAAFDLVKEHDERGIEPKGDVLEAVLPRDRPVLILMDEVLNFISTYRATGRADRFYNFLHNLSEVARGRDNVALVVSLPASELEYSPADQEDEARLKKLLDRVGKPILLTGSEDSAEIVRRRLFEWTELPAEAHVTARAFATWAASNQALVQRGRQAELEQRFLETYPFHPAVFDVFQGKWQSLPKFQRTRATLRLLALWVSIAYQDAFQAARSDPLIGLGTAPLADPSFRVAIFEQLGTDTLEGAVTTDIAGGAAAHAPRLDREATSAIKGARLHQKVLTSIFFESNGGQTRDEALLPEVRFDVGEPGLDIANVETVLENLRRNAFYLRERNGRFSFSQRPNLNMVISRARISVTDPSVADRVNREVERAFQLGASGVDRAVFPTKPDDIADKPALTLIVLRPDQAHGDPSTARFVDELFARASTGARAYKGALIICAPDAVGGLRGDVRSLIGLEEVANDRELVDRLEAQDEALLRQQLAAAQRDVQEGIWRAYRHLLLLGPAASPRAVDLGIGHATGGEAKADYIINRLIADDEIVDALGSAKLVRSWPTGVEFWTIEAIRNACFSSPRFPRLRTSQTLKRAIAEGVSAGDMAYAQRRPDGSYDPIWIGPDAGVTEADVEISDEVGILRAADARRAQAPVKPVDVQVHAPGEVAVGVRTLLTADVLDEHGELLPSEGLSWSTTEGSIDADGWFESTATGIATVTASLGSLTSATTFEIVEASATSSGTGADRTDGTNAAAAEIVWEGDLPTQQWNVFSMRVLAALAQHELQVRVRLQVRPAIEVANSIEQRLQTNLEGLGLDPDDVRRREG